MSDIEIIPCVNEEMLGETSVAAYEIWREYFSNLLEREQIEYMLDRFLSPAAMKRQVAEDSYGYWQVRENAEIIGFIGLQFQPDRLFLSKLYLNKVVRGRHIASRMLEMVYEEGRSHGYEKVWLTCNKYNTHSLDVYRAKGFVTFGAGVTDIGHGYVMDDYFLERVL